jgi:hypothetical protein
MFFVSVSSSDDKLEPSHVLIADSKEELKDSQGSLSMSHVSENTNISQGNHLDIPLNNYHLLCPDTSNSKKGKPGFFIQVMIHCISQ